MKKHEKILLKAITEATPKKVAGLRIYFNMPRASRELMELVTMMYCHFQLELAESL